MTKYDMYSKIAEAEKFADSRKWNLIEIEHNNSRDETTAVRATFEGVYDYEKNVKFNPFVNGEAIKHVLESRMNPKEEQLSFAIKKVIFNPPATIVLWTDNTKTVVKTQDGEKFDPEKGLAMAMVKKFSGNQGNYFNAIKKWTEGYSEPKPETRTVQINDDGLSIEICDSNIEATTISSGVVDAVINEVLLRLKNN